MVTVEETYLPLTLSTPGLTDTQFQEFCEQYADFRLEYTAEGAYRAVVKLGPAPVKSTPRCSSGSPTVWNSAG